MENEKLNPRDVFGKTLLELGKADKTVMAVSCDSGSGSGMDLFKKALPDQYLEVGISEQNAIGICAGLAEGGETPVVSAIAPFISMRCFEQIRNDLGYANMNVKVIGSSSGLSHCNLGSTHQAVEDIALLKTVPNMVIFNPGDGYEVEMSLRKAIECKGPVYIRMPRNAMEAPLEREKRHFEIGKGEIILDQGDEIVLVVSGTLSVDAQKAGKVLAEKGACIKVLNLTTVKPLDKKLLVNTYKKCRMMCTIEEHIITGGFGNSVVELLSDYPGAPIHIIGIQEGSTQTGPYRELLTDYGLTAEKLIEKIETFMIRDGQKEK